MWESDPVVVDADTWHTVELRYSYDGANYIMGGYVDGTQLLCAKLPDVASTLSCGQWDILSGNTTTAPDAIKTYYDEITISLLDGKDDAPAMENPKDPNRVEYTAVREDTTVTVNADIYGNDAVTGDACMVIAVFGANGRVIKLVPTTVTFPAVANGCRTLSATLTDDGVVAGNSVKVFFFDTLLSAKPLLESYSGTLE